MTNEEALEIIKHLTDELPDHDEKRALMKAQYALKENERYRKIGTYEELREMKNNSSPFITLWALANYIYTGQIIYVYKDDWDDGNRSFDEDASLLFVLKSTYRAYVYLKPKYANAIVKRIDIVDDKTIRVRVEVNENE